MDGAASAILFLAAGGLQKNMTFVAPDKVDDAIDSLSHDPGDLLFVDIAPHTEVAVLNLQRKGHFQVIDHHASAVWLHGRDGFLIDKKNEACGCENFRRWLGANGFPKFLGFPWRRFTTIIDDHDRWKMQEPMSLQLPKLMSLVGQQGWIERMSNVEQRFIGHHETYWTDSEAEMLRVVEEAQERKFKQIFEKFIPITRQFEGRPITIAYVISGEMNCSELLNRYLNLHPEVDLACQINLDIPKISLRSNDKVDITKFVEKYGGGGHRNAGGHPLPDGLLRSIIEQIHG